MGAQTGKAGDGLPQRQVLYGNAGLAAHVVQSCLGGGGAVFVLYVNGGGADNGIAVYRGGNQNALAVFSGKLEDGIFYKALGCPIQQEVIAPPGVMVMVSEDTML